MMIASVGSGVCILIPQLVELFKKDRRYGLVGRGVILGVDLEVFQRLISFPVCFSLLVLTDIM